MLVRRSLPVWDASPAKVIPRVWQRSGRLAPSLALCRVKFHYTPRVTPCYAALLPLPATPAVTFCPSDG